MKYPAEIRKEEGAFSVTFPDFPYCFTDGETLEDAKSRAREVLSLYLEVLNDDKKEIPEPSVINESDIYYIEPELPVSFAISLRKEREKRGLTQKEVAARLGVGWTMYQRLENPKKTNPTLTTIQKVQDVLGTSFLTC